MEESYDVAVIGAGIAGIESSLNLANQGYKVVLIEKDVSIGGNMIALSKVFPTLDCASCITTPKMSETAHHDNIKLYTYTEVTNVDKKNDGSFVVTATKKPKYVKEDVCTGCKLCEHACPVIVPLPFDRGLGATKAINIGFTTAIPQIPVLNPDECIRCGKCYDVCPTKPNSIDFSQQPIELNFQVSSVIIASGFSFTKVDLKKEYSTGVQKNIITALEMERILAPNGPYGSVLRPSDGKEPDNIAFVLCAGSRDKSIGIPYCSRVCCMYSIKQAMLLSGALPLADITIYYMDIRAFGKNYEQFYRNAEAMGINFIKAKVAKIDEAENADLEIRAEDLENSGAPKTYNHDMVILAGAIIPNIDPSLIAPVDVDQYGFIHQPKPKEDPVLTKTEGIYFAGVCGGPRDIVDTITEAGAAAMKASTYIDNVSKT